MTSTFKVIRNYRAVYRSSPIAFAEGDTVELDTATADWVNNDSPGCLEPIDQPVNADNDDDNDDDVADPVEPPRSGTGSGLAAWQTYAAAVGIDFADDATRDDIIAAVDATD